MRSYKECAVGMGTAPIDCNKKLFIQHHVTTVNTYYALLTACEFSSPGDGPLRKI